MTGMRRLRALPGQSS
ncbi:hypothetical protein M8S05_20215 [Enterobacter hormaechei]|nr:hypothetical protein [Enterobacter hormaechei]MCM7529028.1 hypothetical protein [Enterobacter hormaechei]